MKKLIVLVAALCMVATSVYAAEWNFYGSARVSTFVTDNDTTGVDNFAEALQGNSRIGARVKASDELTGGFEYGTAGGNANIRLIWGEWNFGAGSLLIGQQYTPLFFGYSFQAFQDDIGLLLYGGVYSGREPMIQLKFGDFKIAAVRTDTTYTGGLGRSEVDFPAIEASYRLNMDAFHVQVAGGYQTFDVLFGGNSYDVDAWVLALGAGASLDKFYFGGNIYIGENSNTLALSGSGNATSLARFDGIQVIDNDAFGYLLVARYKATDMFTFEAGYGYAEGEADTAGAVTDEVKSYYLQSEITLAPGVTITPEIGWIDSEGINVADIQYYGAKWQISF